MRASVVSCCDSAPVFEFCEHVLDSVTLFVEALIVGDFGLSVFLGRDAGGDAFGPQGVPEPVGVIPAICEQDLCLWQSADQVCGSFVIAHLPFGQEHGHRAAPTVAHGVKLGVQSAFGAPDMAGNIPFFSRLAAVRWALRCVASI